MTSRQRPPDEGNQFEYLNAGEDEGTIRSFFRYFLIDWIHGRRRVLEEALGLPRSAQIILQRLFEDAPISTTVFAEALSIDRSTLSRQLRPLKDMGFVKAEHVGGGRRTVLTLTEAGRERAIEVDRIVMNQYNEALSHMKPGRVHELAQLLVEFRRALVDSMTSGGRSAVSEGRTPKWRS